MPDFERVFRDLELHQVRDDDIKTAYVIGKHHGLDKARKEIACTVAIVAGVVLIVVACTL